MSKAYTIFGKFLNLFFSNSLVEDGVLISNTHHVLDLEVSNFSLLIERILEKRDAITPDFFFNYLERPEDYPGNFFLMTFDDGFLSSYKVAKEVLKKFNIKAIFFIPTHILNLSTDEEMLEFTKKNIYFKKKYNYDFKLEEFRFMNSNHIRDLMNDGHIIASHTDTHMLISKIDNSKMVEKEIVCSKKVLEKITKKEIDSFAFPVGTERVMNNYSYQAIINNYKYCFTALQGINNKEEDRYFIKRFNFPGNASKEYLDLVLNGSYNKYYDWKMRKLLSRAKGH